jgi:hypothetical protein
MKLYWAGAQRRLGLLQGEPGRTLVGEAEAWMAGHGVKNRRCITRMIAPGFPDG